MGLAACGNDSSAGDSTAAGGGGGSGAGGGDTVVQVSDEGTLVDGSGMTLYTADVENGGKIFCTDECVGFWFPLTVSSETVTAPAGVDGLATTKRPDGGDLQVTYDGAPLYTFKLDSAAGDTEGDGFTDDFAGQHFVWHTVATDDSAGTTPETTTEPDSGGGYGGY